MGSPLDFEDLCSLLMEEESVLLSQGKLKVSHGDEQALSISRVKNEFQGKCYESRKKGHRAKVRWSKDKGKSKDSNTQRHMVISQIRQE